MYVSSVVVWVCKQRGFYIFCFYTLSDTMTKPIKERKIAVGIYLTTIFESMSLGYKDINEYIDALKQQIAKLQEANEHLSKELEAILKEKEIAKEKEHS